MIRRLWPVVLGAFVVVLLTSLIYVAVGYRLDAIAKAPVPFGDRPARGVLERSWLILTLAVCATNFAAFVGMALAPGPPEDSGVTP